MRINKVVRAGLVLADVAVLCVDRKSVICKNGSSRTFNLEVKIVRVSTISSKLFWCFIMFSDASLLCPFFSPVQPVDDKGEYLREYIPRINPMTTTIGPAQIMMKSPYSTRAQNAATRRKLSHGSPLVHDISPASLFKGKIKGCEKAKARVIEGGVAIRSGDFRCTTMVDRCFDAEET